MHLFPRHALALLSLLAVLAWPGAVGQAEEGEDTPANKPDTAAGPQVGESAPERHAARRPTDKKVLEALVEALGDYLDLETDLYVGRSATKAWLKAQQEAQGYDLMADTSFLREMIYETRSFLPQIKNKKWQRAFDPEGKYKSKGDVEGFKSDRVSLGWVLPKRYPSKNKEFNRSPRTVPAAPLLVSTIARTHYNENPEFPAQELFPERYPKGTWRSVFNEWALMVPVAPAGSYVNDGQLDPTRLILPLSRFARHYHVDFSRIILDGNEEVLSIADAWPVFFSGFVIRQGELSDAQKALVGNYAHVPVFVTGKAARGKLHEALTEAGHPDVSHGKDQDLIRWMAERKQVVPHSFTWTIQGQRHQFAHWINLEQVNWESEKKEIKVEVLDTEKDPNTIKIDAIGVRSLSLYLNDDIVDLDRKVRVLINGHIEFDEKVERSLDILFNRDPLKIRETMWFGMLFPVRVLHLGVRDPAPAEPEEPMAGEEEQNRAQMLLGKAKALLEKDKGPAAQKRLEAVIELGNTPSRPEAKELLASILLSNAKAHIEAGETDDAKGELNGVLELGETPSREEAQSLLDGLA